MMDDKTDNFCCICQVPSKLKCSNCNLVYYCSVKHQKEDWKNHKTNCFPFVIKTNEKLGRYLVASRDILPYQVVLKEQPLIRGPSQITAPVCLGCLNGITENECIECSKCGWPMCSSKCENNEEHIAECDLTKARGEKASIKIFSDPQPMYQCITTLRSLLLKDKNASKFQKLVALESHDQTRRGSVQWNSDLQSIGKFIPRFFQCPQFEENEIMKLTGILQINGHEVPITQPPHVAVYYNSSLLEHSCIPNLNKSFTRNGGILLWATQKIPKDTNLSICYSDGIWGTFARRHHLMHTKLFKCECKRCIDVTEFGSYFSSIRCNHDNCSGFALPVDSDQWDKDWKCNKCLKMLPIKYVDDILEKAGKDLGAMNKNSINDCKRYIGHYEKFLHKNHFYLCDVKIHFSQIIGSDGPDDLLNINEELLNLKIKMATELINLVKIIAPADGRVLGILYFNLHAGLSEKARRCQLDQTELCQELLNQSLLNAEMAVKYLQFEPTILSEGQVLLQARKNSNALKMVLGHQTV